MYFKLGLKQAIVSKAVWNGSKRKGTMRGLINTALLALCLVGCESESTDTQEARAPDTAQTGAATVDAQRIINADEEPGNWLSHGRTYSEQRFSPLSQISANTISRLGLGWYHEFETNRGMEATPLVIDGVLYTTGSWSIVYAFDAKTGSLLWTFDPKVPPQKAVHACCDVVNRGVAAWDGKLYVGTLDGRLIALNAQTGEEVWSVATFDPDLPYTITGAPRVVKGKVLIGNGGAELGVRGYVSAYDAQTGEQAWRFYTVPGNPADGFETEALAIAARSWKGEWWTLGGGGTVWDSMAYDPELDLLYIGVGNGSPWNRSIRSPGGGDNLFLSSIVAVRPDTGKYVWHFQTTPGDAWDYTATQHMILADMEIDGQARKVIMQAPKNGFFYVICRVTGDFISGKNYVPVNWASGLDEDGRPIEAPGARYHETGQPFLAMPSPLGGHSWHPMAFSKQTGLVYIPAQEMPYLHAADSAFKVKKGAWNTGTDGAISAFPDDTPTRKQIKAMTKGHLAAWDPKTQSEVWRVQYDAPWNGGVLATAGGLVFQGRADSKLAAYDAANGDMLWSFDTQTAIMAPPITYSIDGEQYVAVMAGYGGIMPLIVPSYLGTEKSMPNRSRLLVFKLGGKQTLPQEDWEPVAWSAPPAQFAAASEVAHGKGVYARFCSVCHGDAAMGSGFLPDLRRSFAISEEEAWSDIVMGGALSGSGMVSFEKYLSPEDASAVRAYVIDRAALAYRNVQAGLSQ
jgi:alcohol dehydrogenase (cytochrome c)/quinohemoprotein ethanol dehydrogenase